VFIDFIECQKYHHNQQSQ